MRWVVRDDGDGKGAVMRVGVRVRWEHHIFWFENGAEGDGAGGLGVIIFVVRHGHKVVLDVGGGFATLEAG